MVLSLARVQVSLCYALALLVLSCIGVSGGRAKPPEMIRLTETHVLRFVAAAEASADFDARQDAEWLRFGKSDTSNEKVVADFQRMITDMHNTFARTHGFASGDEFADVMHTLRILISSTDTKTGKWTGDAELVAMLERMIGELEDPKHPTYRRQPPAARAGAIAQKREAIESLKRPRFPENLVLFDAHRDRIVAAMAARDARAAMLVKAATPSK